LVWNGVYFRPLCKIVHSDQKVSVSLVGTWKKVLLRRWRFFRMEPQRCTGAFGPGSLSVVSGWLHRCHTACTISLYLFSLAGSRIFAELYLGFY
jgi:hypothetical protein